MIEFFEFVQRNWAMTLTIISGAFTYFWLTMDTKYAKKKEVNNLVEMIKSNDKRLTTLETKLDNLPTNEDLSQLQILMTEIKGETKTANAQMQGLSRQVNLLVEDKIFSKGDK